jgi:poly-gamma-glutamate synthesis protein (capsule biosynthesis protein)
LTSIQEARAAGADFVVVVLHGGHEHYNLPSPRMKAQFRFMVDAGADAVVGHHTHIISGYEVYKNKPIFYSLGNFCFDWQRLRNSPWNTGMMLRLIFSKEKLPVFEYQLITQNDDKAGLYPLKEEEVQTQENTIKQLNAIIQDDTQLAAVFSQYCDRLKPVMLSRIQPYRNQYLVALHKRGFLPDIMNKEKRKMLQILAQCESHREVLLDILNRNSKLQ